MKKLIINSRSGELLFVYGRKIKLPAFGLTNALLDHVNGAKAGEVESALKDNGRAASLKK